MVWLKHVWNWCTAERVQAIGTAVIALVTVWTLFFTPLGERLVSEINQTVRETQEEVEHHRTIATKVTLRALWKVADDWLVENEYFARIAQDYRAHMEWTEEGEARLQGVEGRNKASSALPSIWWLRIPAREEKGEVGFVPMREKGRWGERMRAIMEFWIPLKDSGVERNENYRALRRVLDPLLASHFGGHGDGAPQTGRALIEEMKSDKTVDQLGTIGSETLRRTFDRFLQNHAEIASAPIRVQFEGAYTESQVVELGGQVVENVTQFRDVFRSFIKTECGPYF